MIEQKTDCDIVYRETLLWAQQCNLNPDPPMPNGLRNRPADNWRVLLSIADACSPAWGELAREAAVALSKGQDEDFSVMLLSDIRDIFDRRPTVDRLASAVIVADLNEMPHGLWSEWRGPRDDQTPRRLSPSEMARLLVPFGIRSKTVWPPHRGTRDRSVKGYYRKQFEAAWAAYCEGTPAQHGKCQVLGHRPWVSTRAATSAAIRSFGSARSALAKDGGAQCRRRRAGDALNHYSGFRRAVAHKNNDRRTSAK